MPKRSLQLGNTTLRISQIRRNYQITIRVTEITIRAIIGNFRVGYFFLPEDHLFLVSSILQQYYNQMNLSVSIQLV
jgi:hypothetical protein